MPTPTVVPRSGDTAGNTCAVASTVENVLVDVVFAPPASAAWAVTVYVLPKPSCDFDVHVVLAASSEPLTPPDTVTSLSVPPLAVTTTRSRGETDAAPFAGVISTVTGPASAVGPLPVPPPLALPPEVQPAARASTAAAPATHRTAADVRLRATELTACSSRCLPDGSHSATALRQNAPASFLVGSRSPRPGNLSPRCAASSIGRAADS